MLDTQIAHNRKVLVELSVIGFGDNGGVSDQINDLVSVIKNTGLFFEPMKNGLCLQGEWNEISPFIHLCYERVQEQYQHNYLNISVR